MVPGNGVGLAGQVKSVCAEMFMSHKNFEINFGCALRNSPWLRGVADCLAAPPDGIEVQIRASKVLVIVSPLCQQQAEESAPAARQLKQLIPMWVRAKWQLNCTLKDYPHIPKV